MFHDTRCTIIDIGLRYRHHRHYHHHHDHHRHHHQQQLFMLKQLQWWRKRSSCCWLLADARRQPQDDGGHVDAAMIKSTRNGEPGAAFDFRTLQRFLLLQDLRRSAEAA